MRFSKWGYKSYTMSKLDCITKLYTEMADFLSSQGAFIAHQKPCSVCSPPGFSQMRNVQHHWFSSPLNPSTTTSCAPFGADVKEGNTFWKLISCLHVFNYQINKCFFFFAHVTGTMDQESSWNLSDLIVSQTDCLRWFRGLNTSLQLLWALEN